MSEGTLTFLKLGGSLITDKDRAKTVRQRVLIDCLQQAKQWLKENPDSRLLIGHGSGSFGHHSAKENQTRDGVTRNWVGYAAVWQAARKLNDIVIQACSQVGLPVVDFPISAAAVTSIRTVKTWNLNALIETLKHGIVPVVHGDVCIDQVLGGTILSTEEIFLHLVPVLKPSRVLLAGVESGVFSDFPQNRHLVAHLSANAELPGYLGASISSDVTGGMFAKVSAAREMVRALPGLQVRIFSGSEQGAVYKTLNWGSLGTCIN